MKIGMLVMVVGKWEKKRKREKIYWLILFLPCDVSVNEVVGHRRPSGDDVTAVRVVGFWTFRRERQSFLIVENVLQSLGQSWWMKDDGWRRRAFKTTWEIDNNRWSSSSSTGTGKWRISAVSLLLLLQSLLLFIIWRAVDVSWVVAVAARWLLLVLLLLSGSP